MIIAITKNNEPPIPAGSKNRCAKNAFIITGIIKIAVNAVNLFTINDNPAMICIAATIGKIKPVINRAFILRKACSLL